MGGVVGVSTMGWGVLWKSVVMNGRVGGGRLGQLGDGNDWHAGGG